MKLILSTIVAIVLSLNVCAQLNQKDTLKVAFLGDSFCGGGNAAGGFDSSWVGRTVAYFKTRYKKVYYYQLCTGGETTYKGLPIGSYFPPGQNYYSEPDSNRNITKALSVLGNATNGSARILFLEYSGNDLWIGNPQDSLRKNLLYFFKVLDSANLNFVVSGISPRQQSGLSGNLLSSTYYTGADSINAWLPSIRPDNYANIWDSLLRTNPAIPYGKMKVEFLANIGSDSVHPNNAGHRYQFMGMTNNAISNKIWCNCKGEAVDFSMEKIGDSLSITGTFTASRVIVSGSNDYINFTPIKTYGINIGEFNKKVIGNVYIWYKVEIDSATRKRITKTKQIN